MLENILILKMVHKMSAGVFYLRDIWKLYSLPEAMVPQELCLDGPILYAALSQDYPIYYLLSYCGRQSQMQTHVESLLRQLLPSSCNRIDETMSGLLDIYWETVLVKHAHNHAYKLVPNDIVDMHDYDVCQRRNITCDHLIAAHYYLCAWEWLYLNILSLPQRQKLILDLALENSVLCLSISDEKTLNSQGLVSKNLRQLKIQIPDDLQMHILNDILELHISKNKLSLAKAACLRKWVQIRYKTNDRYTNKIYQYLIDDDSESLWKLVQVDSGNLKIRHQLSTDNLQITPL